MIDSTERVDLELQQKEREGLHDARSQVIQVPIVSELRKLKQDKTLSVYQQHQVIICLQILFLVIQTFSASGQFIRSFNPEIECQNLK